MASYRVELTRRAELELGRLPRDRMARVASMIDALSDVPRPPGAKRLADGDGIHRLRAGDYRILYRIEDDVLLVLVLSVGHRGDVCRRLSDL